MQKCPTSVAVQAPWQHWFAPGVQAPVPRQHRAWVLGQRESIRSPRQHWLFIFGKHVPALRQYGTSASVLESRLTAASSDCPPGTDRVSDEAQPATEPRMKRENSRATVLFTSERDEGRGAKSRSDDGSRRARVITAHGSERTSGHQTATTTPWRLCGARSGGLICSRGARCLTRG
jgi:hypothetical protein